MSRLRNCIKASNISNDKKTKLLEELDSYLNNNNSEKKAEALFMQAQQKSIVDALNEFKESIGEPTEEVQIYDLASEIESLENSSFYLEPLVQDGKNIGFFYDGKVYVNTDLYYQPIESNEPLSLQEFKNKVGQEVKKIDTQGEAYNSETLEKMYLTALYFGIDTAFKAQDGNIEQEVALYETGVQNAEYLQTGFIADFNKEMIEAKRNRPEKYNAFYSKFKITANGIELVQNDPISMIEAEPYIKGNIRKYLEITNQIPVEPYNDVITKQQKRLYFLYNPKSLPIFSQYYQRINNQTIMTKASDDFIRIGSDIYENVASVGDYNFYSVLSEKLPVNKDYSINISQPELNIDLSNYQYLESQTEKSSVNNLYTQETEEEIDKDMECK